MSEHHDLPFRAEYAKSSRASCKACRDNIMKDTLRLAIMVQSPMFDGKVPNWFHFNCFWRRARVPVYTDIHGVDSLRWDDQKKIKDKLGGGGGDAGAAAAATSGPSDADYKDFKAEYAKTNKSKCRGCGECIDKAIVRLAKKDYETDRAKMYGPQDLWHHVDCFVKIRDELGFTKDMDPTKMVGFVHLRKEDKEETIEKLGKGEKVKRKNSSASAPPTKKQKTSSKEEKALEAQSKLLWEIRDKLHRDVSNDGLKGLLEYNKQNIPSGESRLLDRVSDCMAFGALEPCEECGDGQLAYSQGGYKCTGNLTEWTKCMHNTQKPKRRAFKIPKEYHDVDLLKQYKYVKRARVFSQSAPPSSLERAESLEAAASGPLSGMTFVVAGKLQRSKKDAAKVIAGLGGKVATKVDKMTTAVIATKDEVEKSSKVIKDAKKSDIHVVDEDFLDKVKKGGAVLLITQHSIASWGADPSERVADVTDGAGPSKKHISGKSSATRALDEARYTKSIPSTMKMTVKGGAAVDPDSELESKAHVLTEKGDLYTVVLGMVDIVRGTNSYYKLQLLEADKGQRWWVFRAWGRVGTTIGGTKLEVCGSKQSAINNFTALYLDKTCNEWADRKDFVKHPNKFYPIDIDYGADNEEVKKLDASAGANSKLPSAVQDLVKMIFDVESMKKAMLEYEIDLKKMPLGKLSKKQIESAFKVLNELNELIETNGSETKFLDGSNRFYTLIPHDFGMNKPTILNTAELIKKKTDMLSNLLDIEVAYSLLKSGDQGGKDPIDVHFDSLRTQMDVLEKSSDEFTRLKDYVKNTHAATHNQYDLELVEVFKIKREGEHKRYRPFRDLHNRQLLWHGSGTTNFAGILSQGLRIAPPEAPVTGYMFGKGVYFADMVSKSANYCRTSKSNPAGLMLLCEVALGNMYELSGSKYVTSLPKGTHSTKGCGMTEPDPAGAYTGADGLVVPMGKGQPATRGYSSLLYNEYIVYDVSQVNMKYLLRMNFNYKW